MNHRTHSGSSPTVITNPNAFDSSNSSKKPASFSSIKSSNNSSSSGYHHQHQRLNASKSAISSDRSSNTTVTNNKASSHATNIDFDALESIPFDDDVTTAEHTINSQTLDNDDGYSLSTNDNNNGQISAVFKKLTTYFSNPSHKTLTNLKFNNHKSSRRNHLTNKTQQLGDHNKFSCMTNSIDNCAVFENCNAIVSLPVTSNRSECSSSNSSSSGCSIVSNTSTQLPSDKQIPFVITHTKKSLTNNLHHSSDRISVSNKISLSDNAMCRADADSYALDSRTTIIPTATMPSNNSQSTNKRTKDLKTTLDSTGETFSLPRVSLRQR